MQAIIQMPKPNALSSARKQLSREVQQSALQIAASWRKSTVAIIETGDLINKAESQFTHEQYAELRDYLIVTIGMSNTVISKLKTIARNPILLDPQYHHRLPPSYATLYQISKVDDDALRKALDDGAISPETQLKDVTKAFGTLVKKPRKNSLETTVYVRVSGLSSSSSDEALQKLRLVLEEIKDQIRIVAKGL